MAKPFALAPNGGGYLILSIYATLCSLYIYHVQCSKDPLVYLSLTKKQAPLALCARLALSRDVVVDVVDDDPMAQLRRQWDPGIPKHSKTRRCPSRQLNLLAVPTYPFHTR